MCVKEQTERDHFFDSFSPHKRCACVCMCFKRCSLLLRILSPSDKRFASFFCLFARRSDTVQQLKVLLSLARSVREVKRKHAKSAVSLLAVWFSTF